jgi:hypothetical protein
LLAVRHLQLATLPPIPSSGQFSFTVGKPVEARIGNVICGTSQAADLNSTLAYKVQVIAGARNGCGNDPLSVP